MDTLYTIFSGGSHTDDAGANGKKASKSDRDMCACDVSRILAGRRRSKSRGENGTDFGTASPSSRLVTPRGATGGPEAPRRPSDFDIWQRELIDPTIKAGKSLPEHSWTPAARELLENMEDELKGAPSPQQQLVASLGLLGRLWGEPFQAREVIVHNRAMAGSKSAFQSMNPNANQNEDPMLDYHYLVAKEDRVLQGVAYFSPFAEGPPGAAHGGMIAAMLDQAMGICVCTAVGPSVTLNLECNYKKFVPSGSEVAVKCWVDEDDGRKHWIKAQVRSLNCETLHAEARALYLELKKDTSKKQEDHMKDEAI